MVRSSIPERASRAGFTLLELIAVIGLITILMGFGVGFLQRGSNNLSVSLAIVRDQIRLAANTAKSEGQPTEVHVAAGGDGGGVSMHVRVLTPIGFWHFEPGERWINSALRPQLTGEEEPGGRFGFARRSDPESRGSLMTVAAGENEFFLDQGFALRLELKLERRREMEVARLGRAFELRLDGDLLPQGRVTLTDSGDRPGAVVTVRGARPLRLGSWVTLELVHDGRAVALVVDGQEQARAAANGAPFQQPADVFEVSLSAAPVLGLVDEVQLLAYERSELQTLPDDVELVGLQGPVRFGRRGELLAPARFALVQGEEVVGRFVAPGGVLRPWVVEVQPDG